MEDPESISPPEAFPFAIGFKLDIREIDVTSGDGIGNSLDLRPGQWWRLEFVLGIASSLLLLGKLRSFADSMGKRFE